MDSPLISIIIPTYNREFCLEKSVRSALNQTYKNIEVIIVDDCSTDNTIDVVNVMMEKSKDIIFIRHEFNRGVSAARNTGMKAANGVFVNFLDSDDEFVVNKLERQVQSLSVDNSIDISVCGALIMNEKFQYHYSKIFPKKSLVRDMVDKKIFWQTGCPVIRKQFVDQNGITFTEGISNGEDYEFFCKCVIAGPKVNYIDESLLIKWIGDWGQLSTKRLDLAKVQSVVKSRIGVLRYSFSRRTYDLRIVFSLIKKIIFIYFYLIFGRKLANESE